MPHTLLLADDSVTIQRVIELTFADEDIRVVAVSDGAQAVREAQASPPDIVLADVGMPEMDGYDVAAFIKRTPALSHIPVLLLTGAFEPIDEDRARAVGCDGVLVKPFEPQMVISRVKDLIAGKPMAPAGETTELPPLTAQVPAFTPPAPATDEYFDRLDAALANFDATAAPPPPVVSTEVSADAPTVLVPVPEVVSPPAPPAPEPVAETPVPVAVAEVHPPVPATVTPAPAPQPSNAPPVPQEVRPAGPPSALADAFEALLAAEQGRPLESNLARGLASSDTLIDHITKQVIERLADERMRDAVLEAAERLVREEIERIKAAQS